MNFSLTTLIPIVMLALAGFLALPAILAFVRSWRAKEDLERRLERRHSRPREDSPRNESRIGRAVIGLANKATPQNEEAVSAVRGKLNKAGFTGPNAVARYYVARLICLGVPPVILLIALPYMKLSSMMILMISIGLVIIGLLAPDFYLNKKAKQREQMCSTGFPDMMDLMVACVEAGLSLDAAVQRVGEELETRHPIIAGYMRTLSLELRAGKARKNAWRAFADRMAIEEAGSLATMLRQAEEMGTSLGQTLRIFSADMRQRRILLAEEKAMALPAKMTLPLIFFVFPVLLGVLTLPAVVKIQGMF
ncbi:type II secretion system F family protein [Hyphomonas pacifica]|uniref:Type II secretion system protein GspF domain-containing protein n=1 Tax=Hyphomonas pacifica TaxID=1280941 RepID=A0A062U4Q6_9PROT|nr:type II secretion system F family protein [Hyphomonas pacifica]KCZ51604.1 hypothetical protein HY2_01230 [Hyphomonas pacifica]RAN32503.1 hypothetical protein HY11_05385 [Hyphomonas pacifica]RAN34273.1 hypothetical protein HY3_01315 [Hyphomonas pacifica]